MYIYSSEQSNDTIYGKYFIVITFCGLVYQNYNVYRDLIQSGSLTQQHDTEICLDTQSKQKYKQ